MNGIRSIIQTINKLYFNLKNGIKFALFLRKLQRGRKGIFGNYLESAKAGGEADFLRKQGIYHGPKD